MATKKTIRPLASKDRPAGIHPGEVLAAEFLEPLGMTPSRLGRLLHVQPERIREIVRGTRAINANLALRLSIYFGTTARFWLNLQINHDLARARERSEAKLLTRIVPRDSEG